METCAGTSKMAAKLFKFVVKSFVAGGLVYATVKVSSSAWVAPRHSLSHYKDTRDYINVAVPQNEEISNPDVFKETWNKGVQKLFHGLLVAPEAAKELSDKAFTKIKNSYKTRNQ